MKESKKGHRKGSYNPIGVLTPAARAGVRSAKKGESRPLEMHQATCVACRKFCEVPFKPNGKKPVYCRDCFGLQESESARAHSARAKPYTLERTTVRTSVVPAMPDVREEVRLLSAKIDTLTRMVEALTFTARKATQ